MIYYGNELYHYRTKGSKNGERRYQNYDGTWTREGLERRREQYDSKSDVTSLKKYKNKKLIGRAFDSKDGRGNVANDMARSTVNIIDRSRDATNRIIPDKKIDFSKYSNTYLQKRINRMRLERDYEELTREQTKTGKERVNNILAIAGDVAAVGASAITIIGGIYWLKHQKG